MLRIFADAEELARGAAEYFVARTNEAIDRKGFATVALSGGSTPKSLYELLAGEPRSNTSDGASIVFLVSGAEKSQIVKEVLEGPTKYPAQYIQPTHGELLWLLATDTNG